MDKVKDSFSNETEFQTWANGVLTKLGVHYHHISSKNRYVKRGIFDLLCWYNGRSFCIELKQPSKTFRPEQRIEYQTLRKHKIGAYLVYNKTEFLNALKREKVLIK